MAGNARKSISLSTMVIRATFAASLLFPSALLTQIKRAGQQLLEVGPNFRRPHGSRRCYSVTARLVHPFRVRAVQNNRLSATSLSLSGTRFSVLLLAEAAVFTMRHAALLVSCPFLPLFLPLLRSPSFARGSYFPTVSIGRLVHPHPLSRR
jgi:hypothetical protein